MLLDTIKKLFTRKNEEEHFHSQEENPSVFQNNLSLENRTNLDAFFSINYENLGYEDGYRFANSELLSKKLRKLKADYLLFLSRAIDQLQLQEHELKLKLADCVDISELISEKIEASIQFINQKQETLQFEKEQAAVNEGNFMQVAHAYKLGFREGTMQKLEEDHFCNTGQLFNTSKIEDYA